ncbi:hypothetical protein SAY86_028873 [Trapa natans]|uniref:Carboxypeptidase n=1 Tax=Trapa natans TaxID=22666 RepID=A0AAN7RB64_TRANT|nr:hypothetical protein SAY86_028873 [Trapa natans]
MGLINGKNKAPINICLLPFLLYVFLSVVDSHGSIKNQASVLRSFYKAKLFHKSIDTRSDINIHELLVAAAASVDRSSTAGLPGIGSADLRRKTRSSSISHAAAHDHVSGFGQKENDLIGRLPGQPPVQFKQYGGYVTVDASKGRAFFYYFVEAADRSKKDALPLLLWLNGGPGCSSLAYGAMQELGPFRVHSDGKTLYRNKFSWNNAANILFLESPAGVGFSYSNTSSDYDTNGDRKTAADNYAFLVNWFKRFPEYKRRDFYIAGESYAGHYVPQLAHHILALNKMIIRSPDMSNNHINLKGIMIGNAVINDMTDTIGMYDYFASHALIPDETAGNVKKYCHFSSSSSSSNSSGSSNSEQQQSAECVAAANEADSDLNSVDIYNIYAPLCHDPNLTSKPRKASVMKFEPCSDYYVYGYLNRPEVQEALHANVTKLKYDWQPCSNVMSDWSDSPSSVIPLLQDLISKYDLRVWVFSGDTDGRVPVTSTKYSIKKMMNQLTVKIKWHPWFVDGEVGGYTEVYGILEASGGSGSGGGVDNQMMTMTFATVRGAGHQVPSYQPRRALSLVSHFLSCSPLPDRYN